MGRVQQEKNIIELDCQEERGGNGMAWMQLNQVRCAGVDGVMVGMEVYLRVHEGSMDSCTLYMLCRAVEYLQ